MGGLRGAAAAAEQMRARMVARLDGEDPLPAWREAFLRVPRHEFVPEVCWHGTSRGFVPRCRAEDPQAWLEAAYGDQPVVVQVDDGRPDGSVGRCATSTMLSPHDLGAVLSTVDAQPGMRICEIGTGTGYTAAVLAHRLGAEMVITVEIDPQLARSASRRLRSAGFGGVSVVNEDGALWHAQCAPFDRLVCSATVREVPYAWVEQVRPGGLIVTSWGTPYHGEALLRLTVRGDGTAEGRIVGPTPCQWLRAQRVSATLIVPECDATLARVGSTTLDINDICADYNACVAIGLRVPCCASVFIPPDDQWFVDQDSASWARLHLRSQGPPHIVNQYGRRDLWGEIEAGYQWWLDRGRPRAGSWSFTVTPDGTEIEPVPSAAAAS